MKRIQALVFAVLLSGGVSFTFGQNPTVFTYQGRLECSVVNAWAGSNRLVLGQRKGADKSNEITAVPEVLRALELAGGIVTVEAMG